MGLPDFQQRHAKRSRPARAALRRAVLPLLLAASCASPAFAAEGRVPTTFGVTIGSALLCLDHIDPFYFWNYLKDSFGPPYKQEGGAYWFKVKTSLWGAPITDVLVSDGSNQLIFLAAAAETKPDALSSAITGSTGIGYTKEDFSQYSPMLSNLGSKIVYFGEYSKIYCAKHNLDYNR